jgi:sorting nexin-4
MHQHIAHPPGLEPTPGIIDNISDTLLNAFARVRKPDERFLSMRENVDQFEEGLVISERLWSRLRSRTSGELISIVSLSLFSVVECLRLNEMGTRNPEKT